MPIDAVLLQRIQRFMDRGEFAQAANELDKQLLNFPDDPILLVARAQVSDRSGEKDLAEEIFRRGARASGHDPFGHRHLCSWLNAQGRMDAVQSSVAAGLELCNDDLPLMALGFLAGANWDNIGDSIRQFERVVDQCEDSEALNIALNLLSATFQSFGESSLVYHIINRLVSLNPNQIEFRRTQAFTSLYVDNLSPQQLAQVHFDFGGMVERAMQPRWPSYSNNRNPDRKLRIAYLSHDFRSHVVAHFTLGLFEAHDSDEVEVTLYIANQPDAVTERFIAASQRHRFLAGLSPLEVAEKIKSDKIDILVDLAGHTTGSLTAMLALRPAPVQVSYLGYACTTGLRRIDYRLVDSVTDPNGADSLSAERLFRLERCFLAYNPINPLPDLGTKLSDRPTVGTYNNLMKVSNSTLRAWAKIHRLHPDVVTVAKCHLPTAEPLRSYKEAKMRQVIADAGGDPARFELWPYIFDLRESQVAYERLDVTLDPFPYNGTTTTFEALAMGTPVVTLDGNDHRSRVSTSILRHLGLGQWVASTEDEYASIAVDLIRDREKNRENRPALRSRLLASDACDVNAHAQALEIAYRQMWSNWCENPI